MQTLLNLPAYEPSKNRNVRAPRSPDAAGIHPEMLCCEFKGCTIMVYGKLGQPPIGTNRFPGWDTIARPARFDLTKGKGKGKGPPVSGGGKAGGKWKVKDYSVFESSPTQLISKPTT